MNVGGGGVDLVALYTLALIVNLTGAFWATGVAMRLRTVQAGPVMQLPVFLILFFAPGVRAALAAQRLAARGGDREPGDRAARGGSSLIAGSPEHVSLAFAIAFAMAVVLSVWSCRAACAAPSGRQGQLGRPSSRGRP